MKTKIIKLLIIIGVISWVIFSVYMAYHISDEDYSDFDNIKIERLK